jgi:hypothetical protein
MNGIDIDVVKLAGNEKWVKKMSALLSHLASR